MPKKAKDPVKEPAVIGRPTIYSEELIASMCARMAAGESMRSISRDEDMPALTTIFRWIGQYETFRQQYETAMTQRAEAMFEEMLEIADETKLDTIVTETGERPNAEWISRSRLRVDTRKWMLAKMVPKRYGDKQEVEHTSPDGSMTPKPAVQITTQMIHDIAAQINDGI